MLPVPGGCTRNETKRNDTERDNSSPNHKPFIRGLLAATNRTNQGYCTPVGLFIVSLQSVLLLIAHTHRNWTLSRISDCFIGLAHFIGRLR